MRGDEGRMKRSKEKFYMKQILGCIMDGEIMATGKIAKEVGLSEKSVRNKLNELDDFLTQNYSEKTKSRYLAGDIRRKKRKIGSLSGSAGRTSVRIL